VRSLLDSAFQSAQEVQFSGDDTLAQVFVVAMKGADIAVPLCAATSKIQRNFLKLPSIAATRIDQQIAHIVVKHKTRITEPLKVSE
jgi:hypothetical protein